MKKMKQKCKAKDTENIAGGIKTRIMIDDEAMLHGFVVGLVSSPLH